MWKEASLVQAWETEERAPPRPPCCPVKGGQGELGLGRQPSTHCAVGVRYAGFPRSETREVEECGDALLSSRLLRSERGRRRQHKPHLEGELHAGWGLMPFLCHWSLKLSLSLLMKEAHRQKVFVWVDTWTSDSLIYLPASQKPVIFYSLSYLENTDTRFQE